MMVTIMICKFIVDDGSGYLLAIFWLTNPEGIHSEVFSSHDKDEKHFRTDNHEYRIVYDQNFKHWYFFETLIPFTTKRSAVITDESYHDL